MWCDKQLQMYELELKVNLHPDNKFRVAAGTSCAESGRTSASPGVEPQVITVGSVYQLSPLEHCVGNPFFLVK